MESFLCCSINSFLCRACLSFSVAAPTAKAAFFAEALSLALIDELACESLELATDLDFYTLEVSDTFDFTVPMLLMDRPLGEG